MKIPRPPSAKLDANENPYGPSSKVLRAAQRAIGRANRYPANIKALEQRIGEALDVDGERVIAASGGDRVLELVLRALSGEAERILLPAPSFQFYETLTATASLPSEYIRFPLGQPPSTPLLEKAGRRDLVVLASPNNPDGSSSPREDVEALLETCSWLILDEAYAEYAGYSFVPLTKRYENIVVVKTFSKAYGLAGLRMGYCTSSPTGTGLMRRFTGPFEASSVGAEACIAALDDAEYLRRVVSLTVENRRWLIESLRKVLGIGVWESDGNFVLLQLLEADAQSLVEWLRARNVYVRSCKGWRGLEGECIRVSIGSRAELVLFLEELAEGVKGS